MVALPLVDIVMSSEHADRSVDLAKRLIESATQEIHQIENYDKALSPRDINAFDRQTAALIRGLYERWAQDVQSLLDRIAEIERRFGRVSSAEALRDLHGRTMAMLSISVDDMEASRRDFAEGRSLTLQEVRRELRLEIK